MDRSLSTCLSRIPPLTRQTVYLVGGSVRDLLIGLPGVNDIDVLIPSGSDRVARTFADGIGASFFYLDEERRITRVVKHAERSVLQFDFTDFEGPDLGADLGRRDFTINAMAMELPEFLERGTAARVIDPFGGREDIRNGLIRTTHAGVLGQDPLRLLRAVRFAAVLRFSIEENTREQIRSRASLVTRPAPERIREELFRILAERGAGRHLVTMDELGLLSPLFPDLDALAGFAPGRYHTYDVRTHSIKAVEHLDDVLDDLSSIAPDHAHRVLDHLEKTLEQGIPRKAALRFACLLHDIAKPETFSQDPEGHVHFYGHDNLGAIKAKDICLRFKLSRDTQAMVTSIVKQHMRLFNLSSPGGPSKNAMYRYCRDLGETLPESLLLSQADARATFALMPREQFLDTQRPMSLVLAYYYDKFMATNAKPLVTGRDLIGRGMKPGPRFREILDGVKERQAAGIIRSRREALAYIESLKEE